MQRFFYDIQNDLIYIFNSSHCEFYHNNKAKFPLGFDAYIRGIVSEENQILLRTFYPFDDINDAGAEINLKSERALKRYTAKIARALYQFDIPQGEYFYNVNNETAKQILKTNWV